MSVRKKQSTDEQDNQGIHRYKESENVLMGKFYKRLKLSYVFATCFLVITLVPASIQNIENGNWQIVIILLISLFFMVAIATFLLIYYRNIVIEVTFEQNNAIIKTNGKIYALPNEKFTEIHDSKLYGRTLLLYDDGKIKKKFMFQKRYSPFRTYSLDIDEMKKHMTSALFKES